MHQRARGLLVRDELGLDKTEVRLAPHDGSWILLGFEECTAVRVLLGELALDVIHVGSTAVPGLEAKPILDIVASVGDRVPIDDVVAALEAGGAYTYEGNKGDDGGLLFVRGPGSFRHVHVHVVGRSSRAWIDYQRFHTLLVNDTAARARYQSVKRELAARFPRDRQRYTEAKGAVIQELLADDGSVDGRAAATQGD